MGATHIAAPRTQQWLKRFCSSWTHPGAYFISFFMAHFQAATTIGWGDRGFFLHPTVVINGIFCNKVPAGDAAGCNSTWPGDKMRFIGTAGICGRHSWPLERMGRGGGGLVMLVASREKAYFHAMPYRINRKLDRGATSPAVILCSCVGWRPFFDPRADSSPTQSNVAPF